MSDDNGDKGLVAKALGPAAAQFGKEIEPLGKEAGEVTTRAVRAALKVVVGMVWGVEQISDFIESRVGEKLKDVPPEKIVEADPRIAGPAIEALRFSANDEEIREMFANLIAADLNADTKSKAHPSFVEIVKQMSAADAKVLKAFAADGGAAILLSLRIHLDKEKSNLFQQMELMMTFAAQGYSMPEVKKALSSLDRLGLVSISETSYPAGKALARVEAYKSTPAYQNMFQAFEKTAHRRREHLTGLRLTPLGQDFVKVCL